MGELLVEIHVLLVPAPVAGEGEVGQFSWIDAVEEFLSAVEDEEDRPRRGSSWCILSA